MPPLLSTENLTVRWGAHTLLDGVSFALYPGQWLMLVGPNGAGKTTLINALAQCAAYEGTVTVCGKDARRLKPAALARHMGVLRQSHAAAYDFTVEEIVSMGRYAYRSGLFQGSPGDAAAVESALGETGMTSLAKQSARTLSGGELQRAYLAQLLAQEPSILLLDEPANHLDPAYQKQIFDLIAQWLKKPGRGVVCVVHDLPLAWEYGTHGLLLDQGRCVCQGALDVAFRREQLTAVYGLDVYGWLRQMLSKWS